MLGEKMERKCAKCLKGFAKNIAFLLLFILAASVFSGCIGQEKISTILQNPEKYEGKIVTIKGKVTEIMSIPLISQGFYKVEDNTGTIWVVTKSGTPSKGKEVTITGKVETAFKINEQSFGTIILEGERN
jgi:outer membrane lipoprotein-sorting protein